MAANRPGCVVVVERLAFALVVSAGAHFAVLANAPLAPGLGEAALPGGRTMTVRMEFAQAAPQIPEILPPAPEPVSTPGPAAPVATERAAALPSAAIYFRGSEVDERATPLNSVDLAYPEPALAREQSGIVTLRLQIDHLGVLRDASVVDSRPAGVFENAALDAVKGLKFRPAMRNGVPVGSIKTIEVPFHPDCKRIGSCNE